MELTRSKGIVEAEDRNGYKGRLTGSESGGKQYLEASLSMKRGPMVKSRAADMTGLCAPVHKHQGDDKRRESYL